MFARILLLLPLLLSLLLGAPQESAGRVEVKRDLQACAGMACTMGCCTNGACCAGMHQQQPTPKSPAPRVPRPELQPLAASFQIFAWMDERAPRERDFITADERSGGHALPPLMAGCIQRI